MDPVFWHPQKSVFLYKPVVFRLRVSLGRGVEYGNIKESHHETGLSTPGLDVRLDLRNRGMNTSSPEGNEHPQGKTNGLVPGKIMD